MNVKVNERKKNILFFILIAIYIIALGFFRDHIFLNINFRLAQLSYNDTFGYYIPDDLKFIEQYSYKTLFIWKWILTAVFCFAYFIPTYYIIKRLFNSPIYIRWTIIAHIGIVAFALLLFLILKIFGTIEMAYKFPRWFMGWLQSPIMLFLLIPLFKLNEANKESTNIQ